MQKETMNVPKGACYFAQGEGEVKGKRIYLRANSGQPFAHPYWKKLCLDLSGVVIEKDKLPILVRHDTERVIGFFRKADVSINGGLNVDGTLIDSEPARQFLNLASQGAPFECSLYGLPKKVEQVHPGEEVEVNGQKLEGEASIWRSWVLKEVGPCVFGWDSSTEANVFAFGQGENLSLDVEVIEEPEHINTQQLARARYYVDASNEMLRLAKKESDPTEKQRLLEKAAWQRSQCEKALARAQFRQPQTDNLWLKELEVEHESRS